MESSEQDKVVPILPVLPVPILNQLSQGDLTQLQMMNNNHYCNEWGLLDQQMLSLYAGHQMLTPNLGQMLAMYPGMQQIQQMQQMQQIQQMQQMPQMQQMQQLSSVPVPMFFMPQFPSITPSNEITTNNESEQDLVERLKQITEEHQKLLAEIEKKKNRDKETAEREIIENKDNKVDHKVAVEGNEKSPNKNDKKVCKVTVIENKSPVKNDKKDINVAVIENNKSPDKNDRGGRKVTVVESKGSSDKIERESRKVTVVENTTSPDKPHTEDIVNRRVGPISETNQSNEEKGITNALLQYLRLNRECMISSLINNEYLEKHKLPLTIGSFIRKLGLSGFEKFCQGSGIFEFHAVNNQRGLLGNSSYISLLSKGYGSSPKKAEARDTRIVVISTNDDKKSPKSKQICYFYKYATCKYGSRCLDLHSEKQGSVESRSPSYDRSSKRERKRSPSYDRSSKRERQRSASYDRSSKRERKRSASYDRSSKRERKRSASYDRSTERERQTPSVHHGDWYCRNTTCFNHDRGFNYGYRTHCGKCNEPRSYKTQRRSRSRSRSLDRPVPRNSDRIDIDEIISGRTKKTLILVEGIPSDFNESDVIREFCDFEKAYVRIEFPEDFAISSSKYCFIDFLSAIGVLDFYQTFEGNRWKRNFKDSKVCIRIRWAEYRVIERPVHDLIDIKAIKSGTDKRSMVMIHNIPPTYDENDLRDEVSEFKKYITRIHFPLDFAFNQESDYCFIVFSFHQSIIQFYELFEGKKWNKTKNSKACTLSWAKHGVDRMSLNFTK